MPIGETLARARHQAGLTVAQVSKRTRIRETIISKIEQDDYAECGGDFYTRGHIRAIAKVVGADPGPLIQEYDAVHREPGAIGTVSLDELLATSAQAAPRHRPDLPAAWARLTAAGAPARGDTARGDPARPGPARGKGGRGTAARDGGGSRVTSGHAARRRTVNWTAFVGLALVVVLLGFVALRLLAGSPPTESTAAAGKQAATGHNAGHGRPGPAAKASHRVPTPSPAPKASHSGAPSPAPAPPAQALTPVRASAFGPNGGDNPQLAHLVLGGQHAGGWHTDWYSSARFGNLYPGTGLLLDMGRTVAITGAQIDLGNAVGASFQLRVGAKPALANMPAVAHASGAGGVVRLRLTSPARGRYVLVWFTRLPAGPSGTFQAHVYHVSLEGHQ